MAPSADVLACISSGRRRPRLRHRPHHLRRRHPAAAKPFKVEDPSQGGDGAHVGRTSDALRGCGREIPRLWPRSLRPDGKTPRWWEGGRRKRQPNVPGCLGWSRGWCDVASGERDRERGEAMAEASIEREGLH